MTTAELKASLAEAYARGERPKFHAVMEDGRDELWSLADVAMVMPVVPAGAGSALEYALRVRRDTMFSGRCPDCGASPSVSEVDDSDMPIGTVLFNHRTSCPGNDATALALLHEFRQAEHASTASDRIAQVNTRTRERIRRVAEHGIRINTDDGRDAALTILDSLNPTVGRANTCSHLQVEPLQEWNILIADATWRCLQCWAYFQDEIANGRFRLDTVEDFTCDFCRRYSPSAIEPLMLRIDIWVMHGGACRKCMAEYSTESSEE